MDPGEEDRAANSDVDACSVPVRLTVTSELELRWGSSELVSTAGWARLGVPEGYSGPGGARSVGRGMERRDAVCAKGACGWPEAWPVGAWDMEPTVRVGSAWVVARGASAGPCAVALESGGSVAPPVRRASTTAPGLPWAASRGSSLGSYAPSFGLDPSGCARAEQAATGPPGGDPGTDDRRAVDRWMP